MRESKVKKLRKYIRIMRAEKRKVDEKALMIEYRKGKQFSKHILSVLEENK